MLYVCDWNFNRDISDHLGIPVTLVVKFLAYANKYFKHLAVINILLLKSSLRRTCIGSWRFIKLASLISTNCLFMNKTFFPSKTVFPIF